MPAPPYGRIADGLRGRRPVPGPARSGRTVEGRPAAPVTARRSQSTAIARTTLSSSAHLHPTQTGSRLPRMSPTSTQLTVLPRLHRFVGQVENLRAGWLPALLLK